MQDNYSWNVIDSAEFPRICSFYLKSAFQCLLKYLTTFNAETIKDYYLSTRDYAFIPRN